LFIAAVDQTDLISLILQLKPRLRLPPATSFLLLWVQFLVQTNISHILRQSISAFTSLFLLLLLLALPLLLVLQ
jgi:hypothetical protein